MSSLIFNLLLILMITVTLMASQWKSSNEIIKWRIRRPCKIFGDKYDNLTDIVTKIASMDDLLAGNYFCRLQ